MILRVKLWSVDLLKDDRFVNIDLTINLAKFLDVSIGKKNNEGPLQR